VLNRSEFYPLRTQFSSIKTDSNVLGFNYLKYLTLLEQFNCYIFSSKSICNVNLLAFNSVYNSTLSEQFQLCQFSVMCIVLLTLVELCAVFTVQYLV
jgi:hypothetical protein